MKDFQKLADAIDNSKPPTEVLDELQPFVSSINVGDDATAPKAVAPDIDWWDYTKKAAEATWVNPTELLGNDFEEQEGFDGTDTDNDQFIPQNFTQDQIEKVMETSSPDERDYVIDEINKHNALMDELAEGGLAGVGVQLATSMFDLTALAAIIATEGMAAPWIMAAKGTRTASILSRMGKSGLVAGGTEAGISALRMATDVNYDEEDAMLDIALASTFGTALGWMSRPVRDVVDAQTAGKVDAKLRTDDSAGAMRTQDEDKLKLQNLRVDSLAMISKHGNNEANKVAKEMLEDAVDPSHQTAALQAAMDREHYVTQFNKVAIDNVRAWQKEQGFGLGKRITSPIEEVKLQKEFSKLVFRQLEIGDVEDQHVRAVASALTKQRTEMGERAGTKGLDGFSDLDDANKITHSWNFTKLTQLMEIDGRGDEVIDLIYQGLKQGAVKYNRNLDMEPDQLAAHDSYLKLMSAGFASRAKRQTLADEWDFDDLMKGNVDAATFLKENLSDADLDKLIPEDVTARAMERVAKQDVSTDADAIKNAAVDLLLEKALKTKGAPSKANTIDRGKNRMDLDLSVSNGDLNLIDLFDNDAFNLHNKYTRDLTGWMSLSDNIKSRQIKGPSDWKKFLNDVEGEEVNRLGSKASSSEVNSQKAKIKDRLEKSRRELFGENVYDTPDNNLMRGLQVARRYNFTTSMGMAAFSAFSEMARVFAEGGLKNTLRNVPELGKILKSSFKTGEGKTIAADFNTFGSSFGDEHLMSALAGFDGEDLVSTGTFTKMDTADITSQKVQRVMAQASLLAPVDRSMRQFGVAVHNTAFYRHFKHGEKLKFTPESLGLSKKDMDDLKEAMLSHTTEGKLGGVEKTGVENWPPAIRHKYLQALTRNSARQVQKMIAGQNVQWMEHPAAKAFMQFRTFVANSYTKHFLADTQAILRGGDSRATALTSIGMSALLAYMGYKTRVEIGAIGRDDADEYREEKLNLDNAVRNTASYMPVLGSGITAYDMTVGTIRPDLAVSPYRSTGLQSKGLMSNPTADKFDRTVSLFRDMASEEDRNYYGNTLPKRMGFLMPFSNTVFGTLALNATDKALRE